MKELYIWHHLGMGDHFTCNGIVRHYASIYDKIILFYKYPFKDNVKKLYRDLNNIDFIDGGTMEDNLAVIWEMTNVNHQLLKIRLTTKDLYSKYTFDQLFYQQANIPLEYKWSKFYYQRDTEKEKEVYYDILGLKDKEEYIFLHDYPDVETKHVPKNIKIVKPDNQDIKIFDFLYTMEKSKELHLMSSSFFGMADCIQIPHDKLFYHEYIRKGSSPILKLKWKIYH